MKERSELRDRIGALAFDVTQNAVTERPFTGAYDQFFEKGIYVDVVSGEVLFSSKDKFDSGCGWPAFSNSVSRNAVQYRKDSGYGMERIEVKSMVGNSHLGHVFSDGPEEKGGLRYCINSAALRFISYEEMEEAGFTELKRELWPAEESFEEPFDGIYLAGGCFWGLEKFLKQFRGVIQTTVGYANGTWICPTYQEVCELETGHAETVKVVFNKKEISLREILDFYFQVIDPVAVNHQGGDFGTQYRTGIYYLRESQLSEIRPVYQKMEETLSHKLAVELVPIELFSPAEEYHQNYLDKNPEGYCHIPKRMMHLEEGEKKKVREDL